MKIITGIITIVLFFSLFTQKSRADEGMWIPMLLGETQYENMRANGLKLTAQDIYSINHSSLKDAIALFGRGCTGEIVSNEGLLLTNHHCGYRRIQAHSTVENDYLTNGYWAMNRSDELSNPGLEVSFLIRMDDVTEKVLKGVTKEMTEKRRAQIIAENSSLIIEEATKDNHYQARISALYYGNQYFIYIYEVFTDVRLVGAPPSAIGKFGGDTDNWMWPRHTGDFSLFRIYADADNKPSPYSIDNVPYKPKKSLEISLKGFEPGDFTMVYGYPYTTQEYLPSFAVEMYQKYIYPASVDIRTAELEIIDEVMNSDPQLRIMYSGRQAGIANGWKKMKGVVLGLVRSNAIELKKLEEKSFLTILNKSGADKEKYGEILREFERNYKSLIPLKVWQNSFNEAFWRNGYFRLIFGAYSLVDISDEDKDNIPQICEGIIKRAENFFKGVDINTEKRIFAAMIKQFISHIPEDKIPDVLLNIKAKYKGDYLAFIDYAFKKSYFTSTKKIEGFFGSYSNKREKKLKKDPLFDIVYGVVSYYSENYHQQISVIGQQIDSLNRVYMAARLDVSPQSILFPDANATMRITHGVVKGYFPVDGVKYIFQTTLEGIIEKDNPEIYDYNVPKRLKELYAAKDYGQYSENGTVPVAFIATNHTTGGNSGSPVLDADGRLIGINFDRAWEGTMSDINYDSDICRNISLDIRYCLFIIDKYAGATHLINEMVVVK